MVFHLVSACGIYAEVSVTASVNKSHFVCFLIKRENKKCCVSGNRVLLRVTEAQSLQPRNEGAVLPLLLRLHRGTVACVRDGDWR